MIKIVLLGAGNVASHLTTVFLNTRGIDLIQVYNRSIKNIQHLADKTAITNDVSQLQVADIYIIAIPDNHISELEGQLDLKNKLVVHTSGSVGLAALKRSTNTGVFYPLQSFSKNKKIDFTTIPICIESKEKTSLLLLEKLGNLITDKVYLINSEQRKRLHLAAVFVNNFVNHIYHIGNSICTDNNIPFQILQPLIKETANKITALSPLNAQTGPAKRNDTITIDKHMAMLAPDQSEIYKLLTKNIYKTHGKKL